MQDGKPARETHGEAADGLRRERDLGHQDQRLPAGREYLVEQRQVDLRLAAPGDAVQEEHLRLLPGDGDTDPFPRRQLRRLELDGRGNRHRIRLLEDPALATALDCPAHHGADSRRHDRTNHLVERHEVMRRDEAGQLHEHGGQHRLGIDHRLDRFQLQHRRRLVQGIDESGHRSLAEGDPDAVADLDQPDQLARDGIVEQAAMAADACIDRDLRDLADRGLSYRGCGRRQWHPRSVRLPPTWAAAGPQPRHPMSPRW